MGDGVYETKADRIHFLCKKKKKKKKFGTIIWSNLWSV